MRNMGLVTTERGGRCNPANILQQLLKGFLMLLSGTRSGEAQLDAGVGYKANVGSTTHRNRGRIAMSDQYQEILPYSVMRHDTALLEARSSGAVSLDDALKALCQVSTLKDSQFGAFRRFYNNVRPKAHLPSHDGEIAISIGGIGLPTHAHVVQAVNKLRSGCEKTAEAFQTEAFPNYKRNVQEEAARQTVQLTYLIDPASQDNYPNGFRFENEPVFPVKWQPKQNFRAFFNNTFPTNIGEVWAASTKRASLKAWKLHQRLKILIVPTDDLAEHLVYNPQTKSLAVFRQVEWLKAQMRYSKDRALNEPVEVSLAS